MARIPFDLKWKPQIESGEYRVETRDGKPVRIICWDRFATESYDNIIALVSKTKFETAYYYYQDGHLWNKANGEGDSQLDLFIITPEPELSEDLSDSLDSDIELMQLDPESPQMKFIESRK